MGIWEWDIPADHVTWSSHLYEMFGYREESFKPTKAGFLDVVYPNDRSHLEAMIKSAFTGNCVGHGRVSGYAGRRYVIRLDTFPRNGST